MSTPLSWSTWVVQLVWPTLLTVWLVYSRRLHHAETMRLLDQGLDLHDLLEVRERWRIRWGLLIGAGMLSLGSVLTPFVSPSHLMRGDVRAILFFSSSVFLVAMGLIILVAYGIWGSRFARSVAAKTRNASRESEENR